MKFLRPFLMMLLCIAVPHFLILFFLAIATQNIEFLNVFSVLGLSYFFPDIAKGQFSQILSFAIATSIYLFFYIKKPKK